MSEIDDRRQRAREAAYDAMAIGDSVEARAIEAAIETATRVKITREMIQILQILANGGASDVQDLRDIFTAAGFEVEQ